MSGPGGNHSVTVATVHQLPARNPFPPGDPNHAHFERMAQRRARETPAPIVEPVIVAEPHPMTSDVEEQATMARGRKPKARAALLTDPNVIKQIDSELRDAEQERDDAAMSVAGQYKAAEKRGVHREAFKSARRFAKMSREKFADHWRALKIYVPILCADHLAQPDLLEQQNVAADDVDQHEDPRDEPLPLEDGDDDGDGDGETGESGDTSGLGDDPQPGPEADWAPGLAAAGDAELQNAGQVFNAGRGAGRNGEEPSTNPHPLDSAAHALWARGYAQGLEEGPEEETAPEVEEEKPARRRRSTRATAVVH